MGALDNIFSFDVTDNLFTKLQQVDAKPSVIDGNSYPTCLRDNYPMVRNSDFFVNLINLFAGDFCSAT